MGGLFGAYRNKMRKRVSGRKDLHPCVMKYLKAVEQIDMRSRISEVTKPG